MYKIQTNPSGTRSIDVTEEHLQTIEDYHFFRDLIDSNGYVDEQVGIRGWQRQTTAGPLPGRYLSQQYESLWTAAVGTAFH